MNELILFMHPTKESFNGSLLDTYLDESSNLGNKVKIRNVFDVSSQKSLSYKEYLRTIEGFYEDDVKEEHDFIRWADTIVFLFPLWWGGFPGHAKVYLDRVLSFGFAYKLDGERPIPLLTDKKVKLLFTTGSPEKEFIESGEYDRLIGSWKHSIFNFTGLKLLSTLHLGDVVAASEERKVKLLAKVRHFAHEK